MKKLFLILLMTVFALPMAAEEEVQQRLYGIRGTVSAYSSKKPVGAALISLPAYGLWGVTDANGRFDIQRVPEGRTPIVISCLGYKTVEMNIDIEKDVDRLTFQLRDENLKLREVTVTAKKSRAQQGTSYVIDRQAIDHMQAVNIADLMTLLPGQRTLANPSLMNDPRISLRDGDGNGSFGTAVEIDGIRLSANSDLSFRTSNSYEGASTRGLGIADIESIEVITGVPSVEHGDMTSGIVRITTRKGRTPLMATVSLNPNTKSYSLSKGFDLGGRNGILNASAEYSHAFADPVSRHKTYFRNAYSANYSNTFDIADKPLRFNANAGGTYGRVDTEPDPDVPKTDWALKRDNGLRGGVSANWLINSPWITNLLLDGSISYNDNYSESYTYVERGSTPSPSVNSTETGYYEANIIPSKYYTNPIIDSKGLTARASLKGALNRRYGAVTNRAKVGVAWQTSGNLGEGEYYGNRKYPGTSISYVNGYRPRPYADIPFFHNISAYAEDNATIPIAGTSLNLTAGVRMETVRIKDMAYEKPTTFSPRFNMVYTIIEERPSNRNFVRGLGLSGGWGITEKLPSLGTLYPQVQYQDVEAYRTNYGSNSFYAYHTMVFNDYFNPDLRWSRSRNFEVGVNGNLGGMRFSVTYFSNKAKNPYSLKQTPEVFSYRISDGSYVAPSNPEFRIDPVTGDIYVRDADIPGSSEVQIPLLVENRIFRFRQMQANGPSTTKHGVEFVMDFGQVKPIRTSFRLDGMYAYSKNCDETLYPSYNKVPHSDPDLAQLGRSYEFLGLYVGGTGTNITYNGARIRDMNANLTTTTHIPEIRMTVSLRIEAHIFSRKQNLTYYKGSEWAYLIEKLDEATGQQIKLPGSVYDQNEYTTGVWPVAYMDLDGNVYPFTATEAADPRFSNLIGRSNTNYTFMEDGNNAYFMANLSLTKEIGDIFSLSFYVNNFTNSKPYIKSLATGNYASRNIDFSYGATLRIKIK